MTKMILCGVDKNGVVDDVEVDVDDELYCDVDDDADDDDGVDDDGVYDDYVLWRC